MQPRERAILELEAVILSFLHRREDWSVSSLPGANHQKPLDQARKADPELKCEGQVARPTGDSAALRGFLQRSVAARSARCLELRISEAVGCLHRVLREDTA